MSTESKSELAPMKRKRGRPRKSSLSVTEDRVFLSELEKLRKKSKKTNNGKNSKDIWTLEEKQKFVAGLNKGEPFRKNGNVEWKVLAKFIGTKSVTQVKKFGKKINSLEHGKMYEEFSSKAAIDVWKQLGENLTRPGDNIANVCIPQVLTVAALEPINTVESGSNQPNYKNIYNYLSSVTRGGEVPTLPANDAAVILELLEDLIKSLSKSDTLIQREYMHERFAELNHLVNDNSTGQYSTSTNPFSIPFEILEFKGESFPNKPV